MCLPSLLLCLFTAGGIKPLGAAMAQVKANPIKCHNELYNKPVFGNTVHADQRDLLAQVAICFCRLFSNGFFFQSTTSGREVASKLRA